MAVHHVMVVLLTPHWQEQYLQIIILPNKWNSSLIYLYSHVVCPCNIVSGLAYMVDLFPKFFTFSLHAYNHVVQELLLQLHALLWKCSEPILSLIRSHSCLLGQMTQGNETDDHLVITCGRASVLHTNTCHTHVQYSSHGHTPDR